MAGPHGGGTETGCRSELGYRRCGDSFLEQDVAEDQGADCRHRGGQTFDAHDVLLDVGPQNIRRSSGRFAKTGQPSPSVNAAGIGTTGTGNGAREGSVMTDSWATPHEIAFARSQIPTHNFSILSRANGGRDGCVPAVTPRPWKVTRWPAKFGSWPWRSTLAITLSELKPHPRLRSDTGSVVLTPDDTT